MMWDSVIWQAGLRLSTRRCQPAASLNELRYIIIDASGMNLNLLKMLYTKHHFSH